MRTRNILPGARTLLGCTTDFTTSDMETATTTYGNASTWQEHLNRNLALAFLPVAHPNMIDSCVNLAVHLFMYTIVVFTGPLICNTSII